MQFRQTFFVVIPIVVYLANSQIIRDDVLFRRLGTYTFNGVEKTYWVPRHIKSQWHLTRPICKAHGFDIVTIDTLNEWEGVSELCEAHKDLFGWFIHIGGVASTSKSKTNWYWVTTNEKVAYDMPWQSGQPDFSGSNEWCLTLAKSDGFKFNDIPCYGSWEEIFICESIRELDVFEFGEEEERKGIVKIEQDKVIE